DELGVRPGEGEEGCGEAARGGRGRPGPERRLAGDRPVRRVCGDPVGRLRLGRAEVRAEVLADGLRLRLGSVLPAARTGRDERVVEVRLLLRKHQGRLHEARTVRTERDRRDEGGDREEDEADREWVVL